MDFVSQFIRHSLFVRSGEFHYLILNLNNF